MGQLKGLWRDTWWLWIAFLIATVLLSFSVTFLFSLGILFLPISFCYFAYGRYDKEGKQIER